MSVNVMSSSPDDSRVVDEVMSGFKGVLTCISGNVLTEDTEGDGLVKANSVEVVSGDGIVVLTISVVTKGPSDVAVAFGF